MFHKPGEPKAGSSDRTRPPPAPPTTGEIVAPGGSRGAINGTAVAASSSPSSSSASSTTSPPQATAPATGTTTTVDQSSRPVDEKQQQQHQNTQASTKLSYSVNKQQIAATALHQHYLNYFNSNIPKEETKSHQRTRGSIFNSLSQHSSRQVPQQQTVLLNQEALNQHQTHLVDYPNIAGQPNQRANPNHQHNHHNHMNPAHIYHVPATSNYPPHHNFQQHQQQHHYASPASTSNNNMSRSSVPRDEYASQRMQPQHQMQQMNPTLNHRTYSTGAIGPSHNQQQSPPSNSLSQQGKHQQQNSSPSKVLMRSTRHGHLDRDSEAATIKGELENDLEGYKNSELEAISTLERNLPIELSFLIRQQAHCMARMNYLDRQIRELRENAHHQQQVDCANQVSSSSIMNQNMGGARHASQSNMAASKTAPPPPMTHNKNGNFILSDDSGGEYSRATISDDDELSSLLDQIAKSVRPDQQRPMTGSNSTDGMMLNSQMQTLQQQQQQHQQHHHRLTANYNAFVSNRPQAQPQQQPYAIINPNQLHHHHHQQAVPIFVMSSPIAVAHPSSISSNILPGVHFQPEPRYNQYYEDFYNAPASAIITTSTPSAPTMQRGNQVNSGFRSHQQFDTSMSAVEQLVSQKEKRQIISQLKSADNWLKMRSSGGTGGGYNNQGENGKQVLAQQGENAQAVSAASAGGGDLRTTNSTSTIKQESDRVIDENVDE